MNDNFIFRNIYSSVFDGFPAVEKKFYIEKIINYGLNGISYRDDNQYIDGILTLIYRMIDSDKAEQKRIYKELGRR